MLRQGSRGDDVRELQQFLISQGYDLGAYGPDGDGVDGVFGSKTLAAVKDFQSESGLVVDGIVGPKTNAAIDSAGTTETDATDSGDATTESTFPVLPPQREGTQEVGGTIIPAGMRLIRITQPAGTDAGELFVLVGDVYGVNLAYEVGDRADLDAMFGSITMFDDVSTMTQADFDGSDMLTVGSIDERAGTSESLQAQFDRDMRSAGLENPPAWIVGDKQAMMRYVSSVNEGWSSERMWNAMSSTGAFKTRFDGIEAVFDQLGTASYVAAVAEYTNRETELRKAILSSRGPSADTSAAYVSSLIGAGWQPVEVNELLSLEKRVRDNPEALDNINSILTFQGLDPLDADDFVSFLQDQDAATVDPSYAPGKVFEAVNDALRFQALLDQGMAVSAEFATDLGEGVSEGIAPANYYSERAKIAAIEAARNTNELDLKKYDLTRDDIIAATFGEESPSGKATSEVNELLEKMGRERAKAATGFSSAASYVDALGRLRVQGFSNL